MNIVKTQKMLDSGIKTIGSKQRIFKVFECDSRLLIGLFCYYESLQLGSASIQCIFLQRTHFTSCFRLSMALQRRLAPFLSLQYHIPRIFIYPPL